MSLDQRAKTKLALLVKKIEKVVQESLDNMESDEVNYICTNFAKHLKYDLTRDFAELREKNLKDSPFDAILNNDLDI
jgi:hypothetical protein